MKMLIILSFVLFNVLTSFAFPQKYLIHSSNCGENQLKQNQSQNNQTNNNKTVDEEVFLAKVGEFPWMVSLSINGSHFCGGAIINNRWILTASHCLKPDHVKDNKLYVKIVAGTVNRKDMNISYSVERMIINGYHSKRYIGESDVALLKTDTNIQMKHESGIHIVKSIGLPEENVEPDNNKNVILSGWGRNVFEKQTLPRLLYKAEMQLYPTLKCGTNIVFREIGLKYVSKDVLCTQNTAASACNGDSGSPLVQFGSSGAQLIGVVSFGLEGCECNDPVFYTKVSKFIKWININMHKYSKNKTDQEMMVTTVCDH